MARKEQIHKTAAGAPVPDMVVDVVDSLDDTLLALVVEHGTLVVLSLPLDTHELVDEVEL
jgi:hypothetical protein